MYRINLLFMLCPLILIGQVDFEQQLDSISTIEAAKDFIDNNSKSKGKVYVFNREKHKTKLADELFTLALGGKKVITTDYKSTYYKVVDKNKVDHYRVHYIMFNSAAMDITKIKSLRQDIINKYNNGYDFKTLAKHYSMDTNAKRGGDSGWLEKGSMHVTFENTVASQKTETIFSVDIPEDESYFVVLKSYEVTPIEEITVLKVTQTN